MSGIFGFRMRIKGSLMVIEERGNSGHVHFVNCVPLLLNNCLKTVPIIINIHNSSYFNRKYMFKYYIAVERIHDIVRNIPFLKEEKITEG